MFVISGDALSEVSCFIENNNKILDATDKRVMKVGCHYELNCQQYIFANILCQHTRYSPANIK